MPPKKIAKLAPEEAEAATCRFAHDRRGSSGAESESVTMGMMMGLVLVG